MRVGKSGCGPLMPLGFQVVSPAVQPAAGYRGSERFSAALSNHTVTVIGSVLIAQHFTRTSTSSRDCRRRRTTPLRRRLPAMAHRTMRCATGVPARSARSSLIRAETKRASSSRPTSKRGSRPTRPAGIRISSRSGPTRIAVWRRARSLPIRPTRLMSTHGPGGVKTPPRFHTDLFRSLFRALRPSRDEEIMEIFAPRGRSENFAEF